MKLRRFLAASVVGGLLFLTGCDLEELLGSVSDFDSFSTYESGYESEDGYYPEDDWTWVETDDGGFWSDDILDRKSG